MNVTDIDSEIGRLRRAAETVSANLLELERNPNLELIDAASLEGVTAERWRTAKVELEQVWRWHTLLAAFLDEAGRRRGTRSNISADQERALSVYLTGSSIELSRDEIPLAERPLLGPSTASTTCTPDELLHHMSDSFEHVRNALFDISGAWDSLVTRVQDARARLAATRQFVESGGDAQAVASLDGVQSRIDIFAETLVLDPLAVATDDLDALEQQIASMESALAGASLLRADVDERLARARALLDDVTRALDAADAAHREVIEKITAPSVPEPSALGAAPAAALERVEVLAAEGRWQDADTELGVWTAAAEEQLREAYECAAANRAPIEVRNQLRSRLDAYVARARRMGLAEDDRIGTLQAEAHDLLYRAPLDLAAADALVRAYRDALPTEPSDRKASR